MTFSLNQDFLVSQAKWSTNGNYLAVTSCRNKQLRVYQVDQMTQENVWTLKDQLKQNPQFWSLFPIDLNQVQIENQVEKIRVPSTLTNKVVKAQVDTKEEDLKILDEFKKTQEKMFACADSKGYVFKPQHVKKVAKDLSNSDLVRVESKDFNTIEQPSEEIIRVLE